MKKLMAMAFAGFVAVAAGGCASYAGQDDMMKKDETMKNEEMMKEEEMMKKDKMK
jgi:ribosomal protein L12E/L44/L45/RPP1/RPP2